MNMLAYELEQAFIDQRDVLNRLPNFSSKFDLVLQNMPLSAETNYMGQPQQDNNNFLQHSIEAMSYYGRGAILMPSSVIKEDHWDLWQ